MWEKTEITGSQQIHKLSRMQKKKKGLPRWLSNKESACNGGDAGSIPGSGRYPGEGNGNPIQYSCLENPMDRETWWATFLPNSLKSGTRLSD